MRDRSIGAAIIIAISVIILGISILGGLVFICNLSDSNVKCTFPANINVDLKNDIVKYDDYLYIGDACEYLKIDFEYFEELLEKGSLDGTYVKIEESYIFIKDKLDDWIYGQIYSD